MAKYNVTRNAPGQIQLVLHDPEQDRNQTFNAFDLDDSVARSIRAHMGHGASLTRYEPCASPARLHVVLPNGGTVVSSSSNLTVEEAS